jgi:hypothetical protein
VHGAEALLLLAAMFSCNVMSNAISDSHDNKPDATAKETPVKKVTKKARSHKIVKIVTQGMLDTVAVMAAALVAATSL